jgi:hypothetical protein
MEEGPEGALFLCSLWLPGISVSETVFNRKEQKERRGLKKTG